MLSRALVEMFLRPKLASGAALRGGTALHKLYFDPPARYSEDLDLVQRDAVPIGPLIDEIRLALDPWLGEPKWKVGQGRFTLTYRFETTFQPVVRMRVKVEINTQEHFAACGFRNSTFSVSNPWYSGSAEVTTYSPSELLGTKLRALFQRKKGRDLFDLAFGLDHPGVDAGELVGAFERYMEHGGTPVSRAEFEANMSAKLADAGFLQDVPPLLRAGVVHDPREAWACVHDELVVRLRGEPWKGTKQGPDGANQSR